MAASNVSSNDLVLVVCAVLLPPLAAALEVGFGLHFWLNLLLTIVGFWIAGVIHALWLVMAR